MPLTRPPKSYTYFVIAQKHREYKGLRYFRSSMLDSDVTQIVFSGGVDGRGRGHNIGMYTIKTMSFQANYLALRYAVPCSKREYNRAMKEMIQMLQA